MLEFEHLIEEGEVFVFGSNEAGLHLGGAAKTAYEEFGAEYHNGVGLQGNSYAIPTMDKNLMPLPLYQINNYVFDFIEFAKANPETKFFVTAIGTGIAGFSHDEMAHLFRKCLHMENVRLPPEWIEILE